jgi:hypothetical protein
VTNGSRNTDDLGFDDLTGNASCLRHHLRFTDLTTRGVRNFAGPNFLGHRAGRVRNLLGNGFTGPRAGRIGDLLRDRFAGPRACRVRNPLRDGLAGPRACRVRNLFGDRLLFITDAGVRNLLHAGFGNLAADRVRLLAVTNFLLHAGAGDGSHFRTRNPSSTSDCAAGLFAGRVATTGRIADTLLNDGTRNLFRFRDPFACADGDFFRFANGLADRVADIAVTGLHFGAIRGAADFAVFRLAHGFANCAADVAIAGLEAWFADRAANVFVASLNAGFPHGAADVFIARLEAGLLHRAADVLVTGLIDGLADRVALVAIAGFANIARAGDRNLFGAGVINGTAAVDRLLVVNGLANRLITGSAASFRRTVIPAGRTRGRCTTLVTGRPAIRGFDFCI